MRIPSSPKRPALDALLESARQHQMTPEERRAQRRSYVIGQLMLSNPQMSRKRAEQLYDDDPLNA